MKTTVLLGALFLALNLFLPTPSAGDAAFEKHWRDGRAELNGYRLVIDRYGQPRTGTAVLIYVTEPFSRSRQVKTDHPQQDPADTIDVIKLNLVRDFQTGIYDYNTMVSSFHRTADMSPVKVSFSSAEWCGHVYEELVIDRDRISGNTHSYFDHESTRHALPLRQDGILEDSLWTLLRGLTGDLLAPGAQRTVPYLPGLFRGRLAHQPPAWTTATIRRRAAAERITVPAGTFETTVYEIEPANGPRGVFYIERAYPHRVIRWSLAPDVAADLTGSTRLAYWNLNANGLEKYLAELGLEP